MCTTKLCQLPFLYSSSDLVREFHYFSLWNFKAMGRGEGASHLIMEIQTFCPPLVNSCLPFYSHIEFYKEMVSRKGFSMFRIIFIHSIKSRKKKTYVYETIQNAYLNVLCSTHGSQ